MSKPPADHGRLPDDPPDSKRQPLGSGPARRRSLPQFRVILLNNADRDMMFVVRTVMELTRLCRTEATLKMWQAHYNGRAILLVTHRERAELFVELFADRGVKVALEPG